LSRDEILEQIREIGNPITYSDVEKIRRLDKKLKEMEIER